MALLDGVEMGLDRAKGRRMVVERRVDRMWEGGSMLGLCRGMAGKFSMRGFF